MEIKKLDITHIKVAQLSYNQIPSDVWDRIEGYEAFQSSENPIDYMYQVDMLNRIIKDKEDDTNKCTKQKMKDLYKQIKNFDYFMIVDKCY